MNRCEDVDQQRDRVLRAALDCRLELTAYARSLLGDHSAAEDAVQEAMLVVVKKFHQFDESTSIMAWCRAIVRIEVLRARQKRHREQSLARKLLDDAIDAAFDQSRDLTEDERSESWRQALQSCLSRISDRSRQVLDARFTDDLGYEQIGQSIGISLESVRKILFRTRKQLRACVEATLRGAS